MRTLRDISACGGNAREYMFIGKLRCARNVAAFAVYPESNARRAHKGRLQENGNRASLGGKAERSRYGGETAAGIVLHPQIQTTHFDFVRWRVT